MKAGIISDSHDNLPKIDKAIRLFNKEKVDFVFHAGDFVAPFAAARLKSLTCGWAGVFGNNDGEKDGLSAISDGKIKRPPLRKELGGRRITVVHHIQNIDPYKDPADIFIFGHTHKPEIKSLSGKLIINPGECGGWLNGKSSVAIVDLSTLSARIHKI